jgi:hypothetical protein
MKGEMTSHHRAWIVWAVGLVTYLVGVMHRTSFGVAGLEASFRTAWIVQYLVWVLALTGVLVARRRARRKMAMEGVVVPPLREVLAAWRRAARIVKS